MKTRTADIQIEDLSLISTLPNGKQKLAPIKDIEFKASSQSPFKQLDKCPTDRKSNLTSRNKLQNKSLN